MQINFIKTPYTTKPSMIKNEGVIFNKNPNIQYLIKKKQELDLLDKDLWALTKECTDLKLIKQVSQHLQLKETDDIVELALQLEEDIAIIHNSTLSAICFCFPSSWIPAERIGKKLSAIHEPVADGEILVRKSDRIAETMADQTQGSFKRYVWTITNNSELSNHPNKKLDITPNNINDLYFRVETQTTEPLGDNTTSIFFVKVDVVPLQDIWNDNKTQILDSINSMSDAILTYKNLHDIKKLLNKQEQGLISHK